MHQPESPPKHQNGEVQARSTVTCCPAPAESVAMSIPAMMRGKGAGPCQQVENSNGGLPRTGHTYMRKTRQMAAHLKHQPSMVWPLSPRSAELGLPIGWSRRIPLRHGLVRTFRHRHGLWKRQERRGACLARPMRYTSQTKRQSRDPHHPLLGGPKPIFWCLSARIGIMQVESRWFGKVKTA